MPKSPPYNTEWNKTKKMGKNKMLKLTHPNGEQFVVRKSLIATANWDDGNKRTELRVKEFASGCVVLRTWYVVEKPHEIWEQFEV